LEKIEIQRHALEELFKVARSIEGLRMGIETTILLGKPTGHTSEKAISLYRLLDEKTRNLSNYEVHLRLKRIDKNLEKRLSETISAVEHLQDTGINEENEKTWIECITSLMILNAPHKPWLPCRYC
jgi:Na+/phosphate symporter